MGAGFVSPDSFEAAGRELLAAQEPAPPVRRKFRYRAKLAGSAAGLATIDQHGVFSFRPRYSRKVYRAPVEALAQLIVQRDAMAEAARIRAARAGGGGKHLVRRGR